MRQDVISATTLVTGGAVKCWGYVDEPTVDPNQGTPLPAYGLGDGNTGGSVAPTSVAGITGATQISAGLDTACAVLPGGILKCWGLLDTITTNASTELTPVTVAGIDPVSYVSTNGNQTCVVTTTGAVQCWGRNDRGQLGDGTHIDSLTPITVPGVSGAKTVFTSWIFTSAKTSSTVWCWGDVPTDSSIDPTGVLSNIPAPAEVPNSAGVVGLGSIFSAPCGSSGATGLSCWKGDGAGGFAPSTSTADSRRHHRRLPATVSPSPASSLEER